MNKLKAGVVLAEPDGDGVYMLVRRDRRVTGQETVFWECLVLCMGECDPYDYPENEGSTIHIREEWLQNRAVEPY